MLVVVLGGGIDLRGNLPPYVYMRLDKAYELYESMQATHLVLSGKYSFLYHHKKPPVTEAEKMAEYVIEKGVPKRHVLLERRAKDTIGNAYYLKKYIFLPRKQTEAAIVTSRFHLPRVTYIFQKIFGRRYQLEYIGTKDAISRDDEKHIVQRQRLLLLKTQEMLALMKEGDHDFLKGKIYKTKFYREERADWVVDFVSKGTL